MDAVLLAAGLGTRLRPHTLTIPKPLLPVQGRAVLDWTIAALPRQVNRLVVVVNYLAEQVEGYLSAQKHIPNWVTVRQAIPRGTWDALWSCRNSLSGGSFLVLNGDDLFGAADLNRLASLPEQGFEGGVLTHQVPNPRQYGIAFTRADGTLEKLVEKPDLPGPMLANTGAYLYPGRAFDHQPFLSPRNEYEITDLVNLLARDGKMTTVSANAWRPIGDIPAWEAAQAADLTAFMRTA
ncbi:MAG: nucleotidyltransferase family protein [Planctomycetota bacterium]|nr:MAG: nucleotidyltransferase family protein [Planctomycetota bacterium]